MSRYEENEGYSSSPNMRQRDLVLSTNEFCFLQSKTNGAIKTYTGPITMTISQQESLVVFNPKTKRFEETQDFEKARQLFTSAPEGWYVVLKNPSVDGSYPDAAKAVNSPELNIGRKVNIAGPCSFSLFPGQMTKVVRGHRLRSNQYLLARVYDAAAAEQGMASATVIDTEGKEVENKTEKYFAGQLLVIKGTEVSFYMPPTGIEVIAAGGRGDTYVRDAVTLERLEYAILKDEDGNKRYMHGPAVVFPEPTETFVETPKGGNIFRALELSPISGIYVKVIAEYDDVDKKGNKVHHPIGEELFITGNDQMIYYPRPEHAMIQYDGKYMHHAIAIPEGEGRYILNRLTGVITTVKGPKMYLPDPRVEVVVKRKLTTKECNLIYPGNPEVLAYNAGLSEKTTEKLSRRGQADTTTDALNNVYATSNQEDTLAIFEANANISRGVSYTKPRTITLDTKYDGVVSVDVWTGYAVNVVSKGGSREVVVGPTTRLLNYDETLECMELSTGKPKTTDHLLETAFLRIENNKISDIINVQTKDFVDVQIKVSYCVDFLEEYKDKWFSVENYVKYLCDREKSLVKREAKQHSIEDFYANSTDIVRNVVLDLGAETKDNQKIGRLFNENGMLVHDVEVLSIGVEASVANILESHQTEMIEKSLELSDAAKKMEVVEQLASYEKREAELKNQNQMLQIELKKAYEAEKLAAQAELDATTRAQEEAVKKAEADMQTLLDQIQTAKLERAKKEDDAKIATEKALAAIEKDKQDAYAKTVAAIMDSITPELVSAMTSKSNADMLSAVSKSIAPYALAKDESVAEVTNKLLRGTTLEGVIDNIGAFKISE
jgi:major vault protein